MNERVKRGLSSLLPRSVVALARQKRLSLLRARNRDRGPAEVFAEIYREGRWGGEPGVFSSGSGSTATHAELYAGIVQKFAREHGVRRIVDLGCGDFAVGGRLVHAEFEYIGVDIVPALVEHNQRWFGSERVRFVCRDIIQDELPDGELCLVRQVLQHLSNEQIASVLGNLTRYRHVLVTEHYPALDVESRPNLDKPCGEDVRVYDDSAVYLDAPPFLRRVSGPLLDVDAGQWLVRPGERIRTYLIENGVA